MARSSRIRRPLPPGPRGRPVVYECVVCSDTTAVWPGEQVASRMKGGVGRPWVRVHTGQDKWACPRCAGAIGRSRGVA